MYARTLLIAVLMLLADDALSNGSHARHMCVVEAGGAACWGASEKLQAGQAIGYTSPNPKFVGGFEAGTGVTSVAVGDSHSCAVKQGEVWCWGDNKYGQLGRAGNGGAPGKVDLAAAADLVVAGDNHSCARTAVGLFCWGSDSHGQLGNGPVESDNKFAPQFLGLVGLVAAGGNQLCATGNSQASNNFLLCSGDNSYRQLSGQLPSSDVSTLTAVPSGDMGVITSLALGAYHTCATQSSATRCWGANSAGQLGTGSFNDQSQPPGLSVGVFFASKLAAGRAHSCLLAAGNVHCWGENGYGQVGNTGGDEVITNEPEPALVEHEGVHPGNATDLQVAGEVGCSRHAAGWRCWGLNEAGALGIGKSEVASSPQLVRDFNNGAVTEVGDYAVVDGGGQHTCAAHIKTAGDAGALSCWGSNRRGQFGDSFAFDLDRAGANANSSLANDAKEVQAGEMHTCVKTGVDTVKCWGANSEGQVGDGTFIDRNNPFQAGFSNRKFLAVGRNHGCSAGPAGTVACWGSDSYGQLGNGAPSSSSNIPVAVTTTPATLLAAGSDHTCALEAAGIRCWGDNIFGQLGDGGLPSRKNPLPYTEVIGVDADEVVDLEGGYFHTCALMADSKVRCWGQGLRGQLGRGSTASSPTAEVAVLLAAGTVSDISVGAFHACALVSGGIQCWGANDRGQLGDGSQTDRHSPVWVAGIGPNSGAISLGVGMSHSCAVVASGATNNIKCWGSALNGRLGNLELGYRTKSVSITVGGDAAAEGTIFRDGFEQP